MDSSLIPRHSSLRTDPTLPPRAAELIGLINQLVRDWGAPAATDAEEEEIARKIAPLEKRMKQLYEQLPSPPRSLADIAAYAAVAWYYSPRSTEGKLCALTGDRVDQTAAQLTHAVLQYVGLDVSCDIPAHDDTLYYLGGRHAELEDELWPNGERNPSISEAEFETKRAECHRILEKIALIPAVTPGGLGVKARALKQYFVSEDPRALPYEKMVEKDDSDEIDHRLMWSIIGDLWHQGEICGGGRV